MPEGDYIYSKDLIDVLKKKHEAKSYKSMVLKFHIYIAIMKFKLTIKVRKITS